MRTVLTGGDMDNCPSDEAMARLYALRDHWDEPDKLPRLPPQLIETQNLALLGIPFIESAPSVDDCS